jgi:hypothetical protein
MPTDTSKSRRLAVALATPVAILAGAAMIWQASYAAFSGATRSSGNSWSTGAVALTDDDAGAARFQANNLVPGATDTKCIKVTATATVPGVVKGYALHLVPSPQGLEDHILVSVREGSGGGFNSCTGFTSESSLITDMPLSTLATFSDYAHGMGGWNVTAGTQSRTYEVTWKFDTTGLNQSGLDALQGAQTGIDIQWELQSS